MGANGRKIAEKFYSRKKINLKFKKIIEKGFYVKYTPPNLLFISWKVAPKETHQPKDNQLGLVDSTIYNNSI